MQYFTETFFDKSIVIDDEYFYADKIPIPLNEILVIKGVYYNLSENAMTAVASGVGNVVGGVSGCLLGPIFGLCLGLACLALLISLLGHGDIGMSLPFIAVSVIVFLIARGIGTARNKAVLATATKTFFLKIVLRNGEYDILEGFPEDLLTRVSEALSKVIGAKRGNSDAKEWLDRIKNLPNYIDAANRGDTNAQYFLGIMYLTGDGVPKNTAKAMDLLRKASEQGHVIAQYYMGLIFLDGLGGIAQAYKQEYKQAFKYLTLVCENPNATDELRSEASKKLAVVEEMKAAQLKTKSNNRRRVLFLIVSIVALYVALMLFSAMLPPKVPTKNRAEQQTAETIAKENEPNTNIGGVRIGTWKAFVQNTKGMRSDGVLVINKIGKERCEGFLKWEDQNDMEKIVGEFNPTTKKLVLRGKYIRTKQNGVEYRASVSNEGLSGTFYWHNVEGGIWTAVWKNKNINPPTNNH